MSKTTTRQLEHARRLARCGHNADYISSIVVIPLREAEEIIATATQARQIDPEDAWKRDREQMELHPPTKELFVQLFADYRASTSESQQKAIRTRIILESTNLVRKYVADHVATLTKSWEFDDLESVCTIAVIEETDRLLAKNIEHTNPGSILIDRIRGTIFDPPRDLHSRPHRLFRPRDENGKQSSGRHVRVESPWPRGPKTRGSDKFFDGEREEFDPSGQVPGQRRNKKPNVKITANEMDDPWRHCLELCEAGVLSEDELTLIDAKLQGNTNEQCATIFASHVSTIVKRFARIAEKIRDHENE